MSILPANYPYNGFEIRVLGRVRKNPVRVYWPSCFLNPLYSTTSLDQAMKWVDAYRDGAQWAVEARQPATVW